MGQPDGREVRIYDQFHVGFTESATQPDNFGFAFSEDDRAMDHIFTMSTDKIEEVIQELRRIQGAQIQTADLSDLRKMTSDRPS